MAKKRLKNTDEWNMVDVIAIMVLITIFVFAFYANSFETIRGLIMGGLIIFTLTK